MAKSYLNHSDFDVTSAQNTGGLTGSKRVKKDGINYQLKPSIKDNKFTRRVKAGFTDKENFGEVIAATVSRALTGSGDIDKAELVPEVSLVHQTDQGTNKDRVMVASKYLANVEKGTIDEYAKHREGGNVQTEKRHVKVSGVATKEKPMKDTWGIGGDGAENRQLRKDLAKAIAVSALSGDHDVNPGNMMVVKDGNGQKRIARIDFGHAFNDLISYDMFGGGKFSKNQILDFVNRETVNKFPAGATSKLWRDYSDIVPSAEMAEAFKEMANSPKMQEGVNAAKRQFQDLVNDLNKDPEKNKETLEHIKKSLIAISNNVSDKKIDPKMPVDRVLEQAFQNLGAFYQKGQEQMKDVAKLMDMQVKVDQMIMDKKAGKPIDKDVIKDIQNSYKELEQNKANLIGKGTGKGIDWVKNSKKNKAFKGNLEEFIKHRSNELGLGVEESKSLRQGDFALPKKRNLIQRAFDQALESLGIGQEKAKIISNPELQSTTADLEKMKLQPINQPPKTRDRADAVAFTSPERERANDIIPPQSRTRSKAIVGTLREQTEEIGQRIKRADTASVNQEKPTISRPRAKTAPLMDR